MYCRVNLDSFAALAEKETSVALMADLREIADRRCGICHKSEGVLRRWRKRRSGCGRRHDQFYCGGVLDIAPGEARRSIAERHSPQNSRPINPERVDNGSYKS